MIWQVYRAPTARQVQQRALAWTIYLLAGMTANLSRMIWQNRELFSPRMLRKLEKARDAMDQAYVASRTEMDNFKEDGRG